MDLWGIVNFASPEQVEGKSYQVDGLKFSLRVMGMWVKFGWMELGVRRDKPHNNVKGD